MTIKFKLIDVLIGFTTDLPPIKRCFNIPVRVKNLKKKVTKVVYKD